MAHGAMGRARGTWGRPWNGATLHNIEATRAIMGHFLGGRDLVMDFGRPVFQWKNQLHRYQHGANMKKGLGEDQKGLWGPE